jgi:flagellar protein FliT
MLLMPAQIEIYEQMCALSARMVEAARANDWDQLVGLEQSVAVLRNTLIGLEGDDPELSAADAETKAGLIRRVLEDDAEVRRHTEPWMEHVRKYLGDSTRRREVQSAYAAGAGESAAGNFGA